MPNRSQDCDWRNRHHRKWTRRRIAATAVLLIVNAVSDCNTAADAFALSSKSSSWLPSSTSRRSTLRPPRLVAQTPLPMLSARLSFTAATNALWQTNNEPSLIVTAIAAGCTCLGLQLVLQTAIYMFLVRRKSPTSDGGDIVDASDVSAVATGNSNDKRSTALSTAVRQAHSQVALLLMAFVSVWGCWGWFGSAAPTTAAARIWGENSSVSKLAAVIGGGLVMWDIPLSVYSLLLLRIRSMSSWVMIFHHAVMAAVACVGATALPTHYGFFYLGVSELSSIPLVLYNELDERRKEGGDNNAKNRRIPDPIVIDGFKIVTALAFVIVRVIYFTKVSVCHFCPDVLKLLRGDRDFTSARVLWFMLTTCLGFTVLQLYWFYANILSTILPRSTSKNGNRR